MDRMVARRLSNADVLFTPEVCCDRQNEKVPALIPPTVPEVGAFGTSACRPPISLPPVPVPSAYSEALMMLSKVDRRLDSLPDFRSNLAADPWLIADSSSDWSTVPAISFQEYSKRSNTSCRVVEMVSVSEYHCTVPFRAYSIDPVMTSPPSTERNPSPFLRRLRNQ
jgi:hypothetical protein